MNMIGINGPSQPNIGNGPYEVRGGTDRKSSFSKVLDSVSSEPHSTNSQAVSSAGTFTADKSDSKKNLLGVLQRLADGLPMDEGYLTRDKLNDTEIEELLQILPQDLLLEIEKMFSSELPIESLIQSIDGLSEPANMLALLFVLKRSSSDRILSNNQDITKFMKHLEQLLKVDGRLNSSEINSPKGMIRQLIQVLQIDEQQGNQSQFLQSLIQRMGIGERNTEGSQGVTINSDGQTMSRVQQMVIHIGEQPTKEAEQRQFLRQFQEILGRGVLKNLNTGSQISIKLFPEHLGRLDIHLSQLNGVITARILTSSSGARELIESQIQQLRHSFSQQQLNVDRIEIAQQQQQTAGNLNKDGQGRQAERDHTDQLEDDSDKNQDTFSQLLEEITINEKV